MYSDTKNLPSGAATEAPHPIIMTPPNAAASLILLYLLLLLRLLLGKWKWKAVSVGNSHAVWPRNDGDVVEESGAL